jgi:hypothetical protein
LQPQSIFFPAISKEDKMKVKNLNKHKQTLGVIPHFHRLTKFHFHEVNQILKLGIEIHSGHQAAMHSTVHYGNDQSQI